MNQLDDPIDKGRFWELQWFATEGLVAVSNDFNPSATAYRSRK
jgi:hypothetical protein